MKMGKLFSSIATATMVLTTLAPAAVANAATGYPLTDSGVSPTQSNSAALPAATNSQENSSGGSVTATSDASVNVIDGYLILQSVPNFGFGAAVAGNNVNLVNYKKANREPNDGSESGLLTILDSRHSGDASPQDGMGFNLKLQLSSFKNDAVKPSPTPGSEKFALNFVKSAPGLQEQYNKNNTHSKRLAADPITVEEGAAAPQTLVKAGNGNSGGIHNWLFSGRDVNLYVPTDAVKGQWYSTMTWTLNADPAK